MSQFELVEGDITLEFSQYLLNANDLISIDIETTGLDRNKDKIASIQILARNNQNESYGILVRNPKDCKGIIEILENKQYRKIFHHAPFDLGFLIKNYNCHPKNIVCTKIAAKLADPHKQKYKSHSLKTLVFNEFGAVLDKTLAMSDWTAQTLSPQQIEYAMNDVAYLADLYINLRRQLKSQRKLRKYNKACNDIVPYLREQIFGNKLRKDIDDRLYRYN